jgi:hypothetical protein
MLRRVLPLTVVLLVLPVLASALDSSAGEADVDLASELAGQTMKTRLEFAAYCGLTPEQFRTVMGAKVRLALLQAQIRDAARQLAVSLTSDTIPDDEKRTAAEGYVAARADALAQYEAAEKQIIAAVGADQDALKMGALIVLGVVDSGRRITCTVKSPVSGGAGNDLGASSQRGTLRQSLVTPRAERPAKPGRTPRRATP